MNITNFCCNSNKITVHQMPILHTIVSEKSPAIENSLNRGMRLTTPIVSVETTVLNGFCQMLCFDIG